MEPHTWRDRVESSRIITQHRVGAIRSDASVLITSEHRDERGYCARSIHTEGSRRSGPFVEFDCGRPDPAVRNEDELVADIGRCFREASGGTLFLDRIQMMSSEVQRHLMALLDETVQHRNASAPDSDPRIVAGASGSMLGAVAAGRFSAALFYRLNVIHLDFAMEEEHI